MSLRVVGYLFRKLLYAKVEVEHIGQKSDCLAGGGTLERGSSNVTIIVPTRDKPKMLRVMLESLEITAPNAQIIIVNNQSVENETIQYLEFQATKSNVRVLKYDAPFNYSEICNMAADEAKTEFLVFANNDLVFEQEGWLDAMLNHLEQPTVGLVGSRLSYPDGSIQHAGVVMHLQGLASHFKGNITNGDTDSKMCLYVSGVTFALAVIRKSLFTQLNGLDPDFAVGLNDVDFCLRLRGQGLKIICCSNPQVIHLESQSRHSMLSSRGFVRATKEISHFYLKHGGKSNEEDFFSRLSK